MPWVVSCPGTLPFLISRAPWPQSLVRDNVKSLDLVAERSIRSTFLFILHI